MARSLLRAAPYNPRKIHPESQRRLKKALTRLGMLAPVTWNRRSGNLVGGHQRLKLLDELADGATDYELTVAVVDLPVHPRLQRPVFTTGM